MTKLLTLMLFAASTLFASQAPRTFEKTVGEKETVSSRYNEVWVLKVDLDEKF